MKKYFFILFVLVSCIEPLEVKINSDGSNLLVVEGSINTGPGPQAIQLTRTAPYGRIPAFEEGAQVSIRDNLGNVEFLEEVKTGVYHSSPSFSGEVGKSYSLQIVTSDGTRYNSTPEFISPVPGIDSIYAVQKNQPTDNPLQEDVGLQVLIDFKDEPNSTNYYLWNYTGFFQINARPDLHVDKASGQPAPLDCCFTCWASESNTSPNISDDQTIDGSDVTVPVAYIIDDGVKFGDKYILALNHFSLSAEAYNFYQLVTQQLSIDGDIFDPPPATIRGNMVNLDRPEENVIGYFRASDVVRDTVVLYQSQIDNPPSATRIPGDCRNYLPNATTTFPDFWF